MRYIKLFIVVFVLIIRGIGENIGDYFAKRKGPKKPPAYLLYSGADNGFVASYRAYFALDGESFQKLREGVYRETKNKWEYESFRPEYTNINVTTENDNTKEWIIRTTTGKEYERETVIDLIKKVGIERTTYFFLQITEFDQYLLVYACNTDRDGFGTVLGRQSALFMDGRRIMLPKKTELISFREFYKRKI